jgi:spermidine/putrescine transport system ATP-binding protein
VLLLDEPLSALDLKLRQAVRLELQQIQHQTGITFIFVTHDQEEALTMSDRIAVIEGGQVQQVGSARDIYEAPKNKFVADFIGETNLLEVTVTDLSEGMGSCILPGGAKITCPAADGAHAGPGHLSVRPERIAINTSDGGLVQGNATRHIYLGTDVHVEVTLTRGEKVTVRMQNSAQIQIPEVGQAVGLEFEADAARLLVD